MTEFWENSFIKHQTMWGFDPTDSTIYAADFFAKQQIKNILIPGIGYGRNAKIFLDNGIKVTGIEISKTAIDLAKQHYGTDMKIYHGSVTDMPFDNCVYDGIFCYGLIYLLNRQEREKFIEDCYKQLKPNGFMIFTAISKNSPNYGLGKQLEKDWFEIPEGARLFFYTKNYVKQEFENFGLTDFYEIYEPIKNMADKPPFKFWLIKCQKKGH